MAKTGSAKRTTNHEEIRRWVEEHGGIPATVAGTQRSGDTAGLLRIDFPEHGEPSSLQAIDWEVFFEKFDSSNLEFLYDERPESLFCKFVRRSEDGPEPRAR